METSEVSLTTPALPHRYLTSDRQRPYCMDMSNAITVEVFSDSNRIRCHGLAADGGFVVYDSSTRALLADGDRAFFEQALVNDVRQWAAECGSAIESVEHKTVSESEYNKLSQR